jgi:hypothetical protein
MDERSRALALGVPVSPVSEFWIYKSLIKAAKRCLKPGLPPTSGVLGLNSNSLNHSQIIGVFRRLCQGLVSRLSFDLLVRAALGWTCVPELEHQDRAQS